MAECARYLLDVGVRQASSSQIDTIVCLQLDIGRKLGEGSFGEVLIGNFRGTKVGTMATVPDRE